MPLGESTFVSLRVRNAGPVSFLFIRSMFIRSMFIRSMSFAHFLSFHRISLLLEMSLFRRSFLVLLLLALKLFSMTNWTTSTNQFARTIRTIPVHRQLIKSQLQIGTLRCLSYRYYCPMYSSRLTFSFVIYKLYKKKHFSDCFAWCDCASNSDYARIRTCWNCKCRRSCVDFDH